MVNNRASVGVSHLSDTGHINKKGTHSDVVGESATRRVAAEEELIEIERALYTVSKELKRILMIKYDRRGDTLDIEVYMDLRLSESTLYKYIRKGEIQFAEAYKAGELLVFKN